jgi:hypothetical protein
MVSTRDRLDLIQLKSRPLTSRTPRFLIWGNDGPSARIHASTNPKRKGHRMLQHLGSALRSWTDQRRRREQLRREIAYLDANGSLDAVLADAGLARSQVRPLMAKSQVAQELLQRMLTKRGLAAAELPIESQREMAWTCMNCPDKRRCRAWLSSSEQTEFRTFCLNAAELDHATLKQGRS